ncbi:MAG: ATP-binding protein [Alistipes sp.]|nr:ATP-binding protein [Alistipes sp.]
MLPRKKIMRAVIAAVIMLLVAGGITIYIHSLQAATTANITSLVREMAEHNMNSIESEVTARFDQLGYIMDRLSYSKPETITDLCMKLNEESASRYFDKLYLIDETGRSYSSAMLIDDAEQKYVDMILAGEDRFVVRQDETAMLQSTSESIVYGVQTQPFAVEGIRFVGIVGRVNIRYLENHLKVSSFDGRGSTFVITQDGNYILNEKRSAGIGKTDNLFAELEQTMSRQEYEAIRKKIETQTDFVSKFFCQTHQTVEVACFIPMEHYNWTIVMRVSEEVFNEQTAQFVHMSMTMLIVVAALMVILTIILYKMRMREASARLEARSKSEFLSNMSHEIRTPLNGIIGLNELMIRNLGDSEKMKDYLDKSFSAANYLLSLINDILDYSKIQSGKVEIISEPFSIEDMTTSIENIIRSRFNEKNITFTIDKKLLCPFVVGDVMRIQQILMNILGNAVKFTDRDGTVVFEIVQTRLDNGRVRTKYSVADNGCGISPEFQKRIFESFSQERGRNDESVKGTGLGMSISSTLCKLMNSELTVKSRLDEGSIFSFELETPIADAAAVSRPAEKKASLAEKRALRILIAEDNELNAEILTELLTAAGHTADCASNGGEVVDMFNNSEPGYYDLILMDVQMPVRSGMEASKIIRSADRSDAKSICIIACTANAFLEDEKMALESGMDGFITKPIDVGKLMDKISEIGTGE